MLTQNEITALSLSPTKKDFVQIWNELLEVAGKLSERWDPTSTNESDPGIVILKALTGIADKLNYNIDKNILEAFMPTAAQEDSMRKLCDMLGYNMKYYQSAETTVNIKYYNPDPTEEEAAAMKAPGQLIPKFTVITNSDKDISYFTVDTANDYYYISDENSVVSIPCMEGQIVKCDSNSANGVITSNHISENNRFYLPETQIAENGIFIYNVTAGTEGLTDGTKWKKVDNLNVQARGSRVFKFGFDSYESRPYVEFPEDFSKLFNEGIFLYYARTSGVNGNIAPRTLTQLELPSFGAWGNVAAESISAENIFSATSGANAETIKQAYNNFKKTVGTFETLVTCRDYMNKIYSLTDNGKPLVSNILVTDIRNDINRAVTICSCDDAGIFYKETPVTTGIKVVNENISDTKTTSTSVESEPVLIDEQVSEPERMETYEVSTLNKPVYSGITKTVSYGDISRSTNWFLGHANGMPLFADSYVDSFVVDAGFNSTYPGTVSFTYLDGTTSDVWLIYQGNKQFRTNLPIEQVVSYTDTVTKTLTNTVTKTITNKVVTENTIKIVEEDRAIDYFDLVFYPFKSYSQISSNVKNIRTVYDASFTYTDRNFGDIVNALDAADIKTISHNIKTPSIGDILCINNYLRLSATIATNYKVTTDESSIIIDNIKKALANAFNMRELDFGDEIPFDSIVEVIEKADARIKVASLNEPALYTTFSVLEGKDGATPIITEYAVASDWIDVVTADEIGRFTKVNEDGEVISTFNTNEAKAIYNKLAVRNILAGRVPLFNYNNSFKASFSEGAYQVTEILKAKPANLARPSAADPYTIWTEDEVVYTGQYDPDTGAVTYTKTYTPEAYKGNILTEKFSEDDDAVENYITDINTNCKLIADEAGIIKDVTLADGEFVKFRAPNFKTIKTYPAYVNYHLDLADESEAVDAEPAVATPLFSILDSDRSSWSSENTQIKWQKVLDHFRIYTTDEVSYVKPFTVKQTVSAFKAEDNSTTIQTGKLSTTIGVGLNNTPIEDSEYSVESLMTMSGCVKLVNDGFKARIEWTPAEGESAPDGVVPLDLILEDFANPFITNISVLTDLKEAIDNALATYRNSLPTECSFTVYFDFECVPFEAKSLAVWEDFIRTCADRFDEEYIYQVLDFKPVDENNVTILWRLFGDGYDIGKYVTVDTEKLLKFDKNYFGLLPETYLRGIYLAESLGADTKPVLIKNNEEYRLRQNEHLYIEYTPSTTTEASTTEGLSTVTEVYGEGTIIRPSGFETGIIDSDIYTKLGTSPHKTVNFMTADHGNITKAMHRFSANEQLEIRDFAKVELSQESLSAIYIYKNFNGELETPGSSYTLKDGEAIFYTDHNKAEFAYYTSGTQVTLSKNVELPKFDVIELSTILDSGPQAIPWKRLVFAPEDKITFQEFQYITLGSNDTIKSLAIIDAETDIDDNNNVKKYLSDSWRFCSDAEYVFANGEEEASVLPAIKLHGDRGGNGWEVSSTLELDVTSSTAQTLRHTDKVETSIVLTRTKTTGGEDYSTKVCPEAGDFDSIPMSFKTNLACQACGNKVNIEDVWYNPDKVKGFQLKVFTLDDPVVVKTKAGKVVPYKQIPDLTTWTGDPLEPSDYLDLWKQVNLDSIKAAENVGVSYDNALRLSVSLLPNTYGIFCVYVDYSNAQIATKAKTWIEVIPGTDSNDISLLNADIAKIDYLDESKKKLSRLYLNPGINCIRISKTSKVFIKASQNAQGILYFDELNLVNSLPIKYTDTDKTTVTLNTQGLNLEQLGYLGISDTDDNSLDASLKTKLQEAYVADTFVGIDNALRDVDDAASNEYENLASNIAKVQKLIEAEANIKADIDSIQALENDRLIALADKYIEISNTLNNEKVLLDALNNNESAEALGQKLTALLESLAVTDADKVQIFKELDAIKTKAIVASDEFSNEAILADYSAMAKKVDLTESFKEIRDVAARCIEETYLAQLELFANGLEQVANSDAKNRLLTILTELRTADTADTLANIRALSNALTEIVAQYQEAATSKLVEIVEEAAIPNYVRLHTLLVELNNIIDYRDISSVAVDLGNAANDGNVLYVSQLVAELTKLIEQIGTSSTDIKTLRGALSDVISAVKSKIDNKNKDEDLEVVDSSITSKVANVRNIFNTEYRAKLNEVVNNISAAVKEYNDIEKESNVKKVLDSIDTTKDAQVKVLITNFEAIITARNTAKTKLDEAVYNKWANTVEGYVNSAIVQIWPENMKARLADILADTEQLFNETLTSELTNFDKNYSSLQDIFNVTKNSNLTDELLGIIAVKDITKLFSNVKVLLSIDTQKASDANMIKALIDLVPIPVELETAIATNSAGNAIISRIIHDLSTENISVLEKDKLYKELKKELNKTITIDEQLFGVIANILCPNITKFMADADASDAFYSKLLAKADSVKELILAKDVDNLDLVDDSKYLALLSLPVNEFKEALASFDFISQTLLPDELIAALDSISKAFKAYNELLEDRITLAAQPLSTMTSEALRELTVVNNDAIALLVTLCNKIEALEQRVLIEPGYEEAFNILRLEDQLLAEIRAVDVNREFYYNVPIASSLSIEFNDSVKAFNTLMNPAINYDINNINNNFVISKLDIDFLDNGLKIARSSRLN